MDDWFFELLATLHTDVAEYEYRLYYRSDGSLDRYEMAVVGSEPATDLPYILVDKETYSIGLYTGTIENGELHQAQQVKYIKLVPSDSGTPCHASNVMIVDPNSKTFWKLKEYYED